MKVSEAFPSNYLKASDLNNQNITVTISAAELVTMGQGRESEDKLLLSFSGKEKQLVCNKTNATTIASLYGDDTENWIGQKITIGPREVEFQGKMVWAIRVSLQKPAGAAKPKPPERRPTENEEPGEGGPSDSDVPF